MLQVGDRVRRKGILKMLDENERMGVVTRVYDSVHDGQGHYQTLFCVRWDDTGYTECGYMTIGLESVLVVA